MPRGLLHCAIVVSLLVLGVGAAPSFAGTFDPHDFVVELRGGPQIEPPEPSCTSDDAGTVTCSQKFDFSVSAQRMTGTVSSLSKGLSGSIETVCDMSQQMRQSFRSNPNGMSEVLEFSGSGSQSCSWFMDFGEGSTLSGTIAGTMKMGIVSASEAYFGGTFKVVVVAGTGAFEGTVGTGVFDEHEVFPLPTAGPPPNGARAGTSALAAADSSQMKLKLRQGQPQARIVSPGPRLRRSTGAKMRVVSAPGSSCRATARNGGQRIALGEASDTDRDGLVTVGGPLAPKLKRGAWTLTASCAYELRGKRGTAVARSAVRIDGGVLPGSFATVSPDNGSSGVLSAIGFGLGAMGILAAALAVGARLRRRGNRA